MSEQRNEPAEAATHVIGNVLCDRCRSMVENIHVERIDTLRSIGKDGGNE